MTSEVGWVTALIHLPLSYNPDEEGQRRAIEEEKFNITCDEIAKMLVEDC